MSAASVGSGECSVICPTSAARCLPIGSMGVARGEKKSPEETGHPALVHPVYLDVSMMVSFLAALRDGVEFENTVTRRDLRSAAKDREASGKVRLPPLA